MSGVHRHQLAEGYTVPRIITGTWQLSEGHARAPLPHGAVLRRFATLLDHGFSAFDCADIYTGVEELLGEFLRGLPAATRQRVQIHTKFVPDRDALAGIDRSYVETIIDRSLRRLGVERLDLVQFSWWDYGVPGYVDAAGHLGELQRAGKIRRLGATNFDVPRLREIVGASGRCGEAAGQRGTAGREGRAGDLVSNQVQYSLLDCRPEPSMAAFCEEQAIALLCYGALAGGFLTESWIGVPGPPSAPANRSLTKYALIIEEFGGWSLYQELLAALAAIADKHGTSIAVVALRWLLDQRQVAAAILGISRHERVADTLAVFDLALDGDDRNAIEAILGRRHGPRGEVFGLEREPAGRHAAIMRYNLNAGSGEH